MDDEKVVYTIIVSTPNKRARDAVLTALEAMDPEDEQRLGLNISVNEERVRKPPAPD